MPKTRPLTALLTASVALALTACGTTTSGITATGTPDTAASAATDAVGTIRIGTGITPETRHAAHLYAAALIQQGYTTEIVDTGSTRDQTFDAMGIDITSTATADPTATAPAEGHVHIVPDLSGDLLLYLTDNGTLSPTHIEENRASARATAEATTTAEGTIAAESAETTADTDGAPDASATPSPTASTGLNLRGLTSSDIVGYVDRALPDTVQLLDASKATNRYGYAITTATATKYGISSMSNLEPHCPHLTLTVTDTYTTTPNGASSLTDDYSCQPTVVNTHSNRATLAEDLITGAADLAYLYSTSTEISQHSLTFLDDPEGTQLAQNIVPLTRTGELPSGVTDTINSVSARLDTAALTQLNALTSGTNPISETDAANFWLSTTKE